MKRINLFVLVLCSAMLLAVSACSNGGYGHKQASSASAAASTAATGSVSIMSPKNGAVLKSGKEIKLTYDVRLSPNGNHLHIYVDNNSPIIDRDVSGCPCSLTLPTLAPGPHVVAVKEATVVHHLTGVQSSVHFTVK